MSAMIYFERAVMRRMNELEQLVAEDYRHGGKTKVGCEHGV